MDRGLTDSYALCRRMAKDAASNFYFSFWLLPPAKRRAMCALYAFLRRTDDLGDDDRPLDAKRTALSRWRTSLVRALGGEFDWPQLPALVDTVARFEIPHEYLFAAIDGVEMDLDRVRYETFADLERYCYRVAGAVGLACLHIWGFDDPRALAPARQCGLAFQLTNILRDVAEDADRGRVYLPAEDLRRFDLDADDLMARINDQRVRDLMQFEIARAKGHFDAAQALTPLLHRDGQRIYRVMLATYRALLEAIERRSDKAWSGRATIGGWRKLGIATKAIWP